MKIADLECFHCRKPTRIHIREPISNFRFFDLQYPDPNPNERVELQDLLKINDELGVQNQLLKARIETYEEFIETVFGEQKDNSLDVVSLWELSRSFSVDKLRQHLKDNGQN